MQPIPAMLTWLSVESSFHFIMIHQHTVSAAIESEVSQPACQQVIVSLPGGCYHDQSFFHRNPRWDFNDYNVKLKHKDWLTKPLHLSHIAIDH